ncbi:BRO family protein [Vibrio quintilis]|uniref:Bro-N domain-containing protein n=1 Tax=Vibrio quintilis TaxID=1117707 RepID=A0A1M7YP78_9VIBR|nr:BRO family protein [Vibrio quintilis]SHO54431.1 hypothetical protein VQ7734_00145 [Vibrio quintilis]
MTELSFNNVELNVISRDNQIWFTSVELSKALGYKDSKSVHRIYSRYSDEFTEGMTLVVNLTPSGQKPDPAFNTRIFSLRGAHLIAMFSRTPVAKDFRRWVLDVLDKETGQSQPLTLDDGQKKAIREIVGSKAKSSGESHRSIYISLHHHFSVKEYGDILQSDFDEAMTFLEELELKPALPAPENKLPFQTTRIMLLMENGKVTDSSVIPDNAWIVAPDRFTSILEYPGAFNLQEMTEIAQCAQRRAIELAKCLPRLN